MRSIQNCQNIQNVRINDLKERQSLLVSPSACRNFICVQVAYLGLKYEYKYLGLQYKFKYLKTVLKLHLSTSTGTNTTPLHTIVHERS